MPRIRVPGAAVALLALVSTSACAALGYSHRVLHRVPSPDGQVVAVCQERPEFDGPGYDVRLERPSGELLRPLYGAGDGYRCTEMVWSADGRTLAVLQGPIVFVDVAWALARLDVQTYHWSWRQVGLSTEVRPVAVRDVRFVGDLEVEVQACPASPLEVVRAGGPSCAGARVPRRFAIPLPMVTGHPSPAERAGGAR